MKSWFFVVIAFCSASSWAENSFEDECDDGLKSTNEAAVCFDGYAQNKRALVEEHYAAALAKMPEKANDTRSTRSQLRLEHAAWEAYFDEHCEFHGGMSEGASSWINLAAVRCRLKELDARIAFLQDVPWNQERMPES